MTILVLGSGSRYAIEKSYIKYLSLESSVRSISLFPAQDLFLRYYQRNLFNKILYRSGLSSILKAINDEVKELVIRQRPDIVFVFKGMQIFPDTLKWVKGRGIKLVNYNPDNPFIFSGRGSGNANITNSIHLYDLHFTYNGSIKEQLEREYEIPTLLLPFGFDISDSVLQESVSVAELQKVCFLGNPDKHRAGFLHDLVKTGFDVDLYGNGWKKFISHDKVNIFDAVYDGEFWKTLRKYRVQLNLMRPHNPDSHNMRTFEIPGIGGIMVAPDTVEHRMYFEDNKEVFLFDGLVGCSEKIDRLLRLSHSEACEIRRAARDRSISSCYTYRDRAKEAVLGLERLLCGSL